MFPKRQVDVFHFHGKFVSNVDKWCKRGHLKWSKYGFSYLHSTYMDIINALLMPVLNGCHCDIKYNSIYFKLLPGEQFNYDSCPVNAAHDMTWYFSCAVNEVHIFYLHKQSFSLAMGNLRTICYAICRHRNGGKFTLEFAGQHDVSGDADDMWITCSRKMCDLTGRKCKYIFIYVTCIPQTGGVKLSGVILSIMITVWTLPIYVYFKQPPKAYVRCMNSLLTAEYFSKTYKFPIFREAWRMAYRINKSALCL